MRLLFCTLLVLLTFLATGQSLEQAVFTECLSVENPIECTNRKFGDDIRQLMNEDITADLKNTLDKNYFSISVIFATGESGRAIPEFTEVRCENTLLKKALENYIEYLPSIHAKDASHKDRRSLHILNYTFIYDDILNKYYPATKERLELENIKPSTFSYTQPICVGCENKDSEKAAECTLKKVNKIIQQKLDISRITGSPRKIKIIASFTIKKDSTISIDKIICDEDNDRLKVEFKRALNFLPEFIPGNYKGIPVNAQYTLPVTITFNN